MRNSYNNNNILKKKINKIVKNNLNLIIKVSQKFQFLKNNLMIVLMKKNKKYKIFFNI